MGYHCLTIFVALVSCVPNFGDPIQTTAPTFYPVNHNYYLGKPSNLYWNDMKGPYPTHGFFTNALFSRGEPVQAHPYLYSNRDNGIAVGYDEPELILDATTQIQQWRPPHGSFALEGLFQNRTVESYESLSFAQRWFHNARNNFMTVNTVCGSPFSTFNYTGFDPLNFTVGAHLQLLTINGVDPQPGDVFVSHNFTFRLIDHSIEKPAEWVLYTFNQRVLLKMITLARDADPCRMTITPEEVGSYVVMRLAYRDPSQAAMFEAIKDIIPSKGTVKVTLGDDSGLVLYNFWPVDYAGRPVSGSKLLMTALPHHLAVINNSITPDPLYRVVIGKMHGVWGDVWTMKETYSNITWNAPRPMDKAKVGNVLDALKDDIRSLKTVSNDTYFYGKYAGALARLVLIADEIGDQMSRRQALAKLQKAIEPWIGGTIFFNTWVYDRTWAGLISANGWLPPREPPDNHFNTSILLDYGNPIYHDHHYHNGYFIYAAAVLMKYIPNWPQKQRVLELIRDVANPSSADTYFPATRHKDWFVGHSWANGISQVADGKDQESSSEAINCYYGIMLFGIATNDQYLKRWGSLLLQSEIRSVQTYYHMAPDSEIYLPEFAKKGVVGIVFQKKVDYRLWWGSAGDKNPRIEHIHVIQMMPFTPITEVYWAPFDWVQFEFSLLKVAFNRTIPVMTPEFKAYCVQDWAIVNKEEAWTKATAPGVISDRAFNAGNSRTNMLWWIATRSS